MRYDKPVSLLMVAYNEAGHIEQVIREYHDEIFIHLPEGSEFIIYLDVPTDNTPKIVSSLAKKIGIMPVMGAKNLGYAGAVTAGLRSAKNDIVFYSDSSGKHQAKDFWKLIRHEKDYDIINGNRVSKGNPLVRRIVTFGQRLIISSMFILPFHDYNAGYKILHRNVIESVLPQVKYMKQSFSSELLIRALKSGYTIKDVDVVFKNRSGKNTGTNYRMLPGIMKRSFMGFVKLRKEV